MVRITHSVAQDLKLRLCCITGMCGRAVRHNDVEPSIMLNGIGIVFASLPMDVAGTSIFYLLVYIMFIPCCITECEGFCHGSRSTVTSNGNSIKVRAVISGHEKF